MVKERKTPGEIAEIIDDAYGDTPIGPELADFLTRAIKAAGYTAEEMDKTKKEVGVHLRPMRLRRAS